MKTTILASKRVTRAFQVLCDNATLLESNWLNPILITDNDNLITRSGFSVKIDSASSIYAGVSIDMLCITIYPDFLIVAFATGRDFDKWYSYEGNPLGYFVG